MAAAVNRWTVRLKNGELVTIEASETSGASILQALEKRGLLPTDWLSDDACSIETVKAEDAPLVAGHFAVWELAAGTWYMRRTFDSFEDAKAFARSVGKKTKIRRF